MEKLSINTYGPYITRLNLPDTQGTPRGSNTHSVNLDSPAPDSPSLHRSTFMLKSIILPNGQTFQEQLTSIFLKHEKSKADVKLIYELIRDFHFMIMLCHPTEDRSDFDLEDVLELVRKMNYIKVETGSILYNQGDPSDGKLYVVFSGEVALVVKDHDHITAQNYERFENEQKKRTIDRLGSCKNINLTSTPRLPVLDSQEVENETDDHLFDLLKSYIANNGNLKIAKNKQKPISKDEPPEETGGDIVRRGLRRVSGLTKAVMQFKKVLKQRHKVINNAQSYGVVRDKLEKGGYFGGTISLESKKREETAFALKESELLVIDYKDIQSMKLNYTKRRIALRNFMFDNFPKVDQYQSEKIVASLLSTIEERSYDVNSFITTEGQAGNEFYVLRSGTCEIIKEIIIDEGHALDSMMAQSRSLLRVKPNLKKKLKLTAVSKGVFIGDELVFHAKKYCFSVKVTSSKASVIAINRRNFAARFPEPVFNDCKALYHKKIQHYLDILKNLLMSSQYITYELDVDEATNNKRTGYDRLDIKGLWNPIKLRAKKKSGSIAPLKSDISPSLNVSPLLSQRTYSPMKSPLISPHLSINEKESYRIDFMSEAVQSTRSNKNSMKELPRLEIRNNMKNFMGTNQLVNRRHKNQSMGGTNGEQDTKKLGSLENIGDDLTDDNKNFLEALITPKMSQHNIDEEIDRIKNSYRARTALKSDIVNKKVMYQGREHIAYISNTQSQFKGVIDLKLYEGPNYKMFEKLKSPKDEAPDIENIRLDLELNEKNERKRHTHKKHSSKYRPILDSLKPPGAEKDMNPESNLGSSKRNTSQPCEEQVSEKTARKIQGNKFKLDLNININISSVEELNIPATTREYSTNILSSTNAKLKKTDRIGPIPSPLLSMHQSFIKEHPLTGKAINPLDIKNPMNINEYVALKKHLKLKEKIYNNDAEESESQKNGLTSRYESPQPVSTRKDGSSDFRKKGLNHEAVENINKRSPKVKICHSLQNSGTKQSDGVAEDGEKSELKKGSKYQWANRHEILLREKGRALKQLKKSGFKTAYGTSDSYFNSDNQSKKLPTTKEKEL